MISEAIWEDKKWTKGSSRTDIRKFILKTYDVDEEKLKENLTNSLNKMLETDSKTGYPCLKKQENNYKLTAQWRKAWKKKAGIRRQKRKDPDAPKNPRNSYLWYFQDVRENFKEKYPEKDHREITTLVAEEWKNLGKKKKKKYEEMALQDKERYERELKAYKKKKESEKETSDESSDSKPSKKKKRRYSSDSESGKSDRKKRRKKGSSSSESSGSKEKKKKSSDDKVKRRLKED
jgi:hypothetical protein